MAGQFIKEHTQFLSRRNSVTEDVESAHTFTMQAEVGLKESWEALPATGLTPTPKELQRGRKDQTQWTSN